MPRALDLRGQRFGRLVVLERDRDDHCGNRRWLCRCDCGATRAIRYVLLSTGKTRSCGCLRREVATRNATLHGRSRSVMYACWKSMRTRCLNPREPAYANYGGRGITVCSRWDSFQAFLDDMGPRPSPRHSIDRIDNNGGYEPGNCRWATRREQANNTRRNYVIDAFGERRTLSEWSARFGVQQTTISDRIRKHGWPAERAVREPPQPRNSKRT